MKLYDKVYDKDKELLNIYDFKANKDVLDEFRFEHMNQNNDSCFTATCYEGNPIFEHYKNELDNKIFKEEEVNDMYSLRGHVLEKGLESGRNVQSIIDSFCYGYQNNKSVARVQYYNKDTGYDYLRYFLLTRDCYENCFDSRYKQMRYILELPEILYFLYLIENQKFVKLDDYYKQNKKWIQASIKEVLELFKLELIDNCNLDELKKYDKCGITDNAYGKVVERAYNDAHVLRLVKKG